MPPKVTKGRGMVAVSVAGVDLTIANLLAMENLALGGMHDGLMEVADKVVKVGIRGDLVPEESGALKRSGFVAGPDDTVVGVGGTTLKGARTSLSSGRVSGGTVTYKAGFGRDEIMDPEGWPTSAYAHKQHELNPNGHRNYLTRATAQVAPEIGEIVATEIAKKIGAKFG